MVQRLHFCNINASSTCIYNRNNLRTVCYIYVADTCTTVEIRVFQACAFKTCKVVPFTNLDTCTYIITVAHSDNHSYTCRCTHLSREDLLALSWSDCRSRLFPEPFLSRRWCLLSMELLRSGRSSLFTACKWSRLPLLTWRYREEEMEATMHTNSRTHKFHACKSRLPCQTFDGIYV